MTDSNYHLRFPIGEFVFPKEVPDSLFREWIEEIIALPENLKTCIKSMPNEALGWKYRSGGWTIRQVIHHMADSHINSISRFKLTLTEDRPTIRPYLEAKWAELADTQDQDIHASLKILEGVHARLGTL